MKIRSEKHSPYFNLKDAFKEKHCAICYLARRAVYRFFDDLLYERVNDPGIRESLRKAKGFCEKHFWQLVEFGDGFGVSALAQDVLELFKSEWQRESRKSKKTNRVPALCPACEHFQTTEKNYLSLFLENFDDLELKYAFERSFGLCVDHFRMIYQQMTGKSQKERLLTTEVLKIEELVRELEEFRRKHSHEYHHEKIGEEGDSWIRAVEFLKGRSDILHEKLKPSSPE